MRVKVDERGRLYLPREFREKIGREVYLVDVKDGVLIIPKPTDPVKELEEIGSLIPERSIKELKKDILKMAEEEIE
jgi:bifunctional DNA-binding transcriptional regulator/antitoxin component of YhaV-PrlF toxin-antitoxin module